MQPDPTSLLNRNEAIFHLDTAARRSFYAKFGKRLIDVTASAIGLALLSPVFLIVAVAIKWESSGPVFFRQRRVGKGGKPFRIIKFRSMVSNAATAGPALTTHEDRRITAVGRFIRRTKLDELPQLVNVLCGEMSLVGPRPEVPEFVAFYSTSQQNSLMSMRPGMTDYAAILYRDESALLREGDDPVAVYREKIMPAKFALYEYYGRNITLSNDMRLVLATVMVMAGCRVPDWCLRSAADAGPSNAGRRV
jgi:lipopolysaccharide/colanic/teichoic acid biosynthesis glycosyltransferase